MTTNDPGQPESAPYGSPPSDWQEQPRKKGRRWLKILIAILVLLSGAASVYSFISSVLHDPVPGIVTQYYTAIKNQDYASAYNYLGLHQSLSGLQSNPGRGIVGGWGFPGGLDLLTLSEFTQEAQYADTTQGKVRTFNIENTMRPLNSSGSYTATASVRVTRNGDSYYVNLNLQQIGGGDWKIIGYDSL